MADAMKQSMPWFCNLGYVQRDWLKELCAKAGQAWVDVHKLDATLQEQYECGNVYRDGTGNVVQCERDAEQMWFNTKVRDSRTGVEVVMKFFRDEKGSWKGVQFDHGVRKAGFFGVGFAKIYRKKTDGSYEMVSWMEELCRLSGSNVDKKSIDEYIDRQVKNGTSFCYCNGDPANAVTADMQVFDTGLCFERTKEPIFARFLRGKGKGWSWTNMTFETREHIPVRQNEIPNDDFLFRFADMFQSSESVSWMELLKSSVLEEDWSFGSKDEYGMLKQYLKQIYLKSRHDGCVVEKIGLGAAFDTGLVNATYDSVYAYFVPNREANAQPWMLRGFCVKAKGPLGKEMWKTLGDELGDGVHWFDDPKRLCFEPNSEVEADTAHCLIPRAFRLPDHLWRKVLSVENELKPLYDEWKAIYNRQKDNGDYTDEGENWRRSLKQSRFYDAVELELKKELDAAVELAQKKVKWDYTTAVPIYYPRKQNFAFLLPMSFGTDKNRVDCALVVERVGQNTKTGRWLYQGQTILTPYMAYNDARLLKRPDVSWLRSVRNEENG